MSNSTARSSAEIARGVKSGIESPQDIAKVGLCICIQCHGYFGIGGVGELREGEGEESEEGGEGGNDHEVGEVRTAIITRKITPR